MHCHRLRCAQEIVLHRKQCCTERLSGSPLAGQTVVGTLPAAEEEEGRMVGAGRPPPPQQLRMQTFPRQALRC